MDVRAGVSLRSVIAAAGLSFALQAAPGAAQAFCAGTDKDFPGYRPDYYSVSQEFSRAKYVVEVQVERETWLGEDGKPKALQPPFQNNGPRPWGFDAYVGAYYDVAVIRPYKGPPPEHFRLFSENTTARFWLKVGWRYLVFVTEEKEEDLGNQTVLTLDTCGNLERWKSTSTAARQVMRLSNPRPSSGPR